MKTFSKFLLILSITGLFFILNVDMLKAQVIVSAKPVKPSIVKNSIKHNSGKHIHQYKPGFTWIAGHWTYDIKKRKYVWVSGKYIEAKKGQIWVSGHWEKVHGGYKWIPGHWKRKLNGRKAPCI